MMLHRPNRCPERKSSLRILQRSLPIAAACAGLLATALAAGQAQAPAPKAPAGGPAGTAKVVLFDGKTLDGWKKTDFHEAGEVKVEGGRIVLAVGDPMTGITTTRKDLPKTNYELTYEAMRTSGGDFFAAATFPVGGSYITLVNGGWSGFVTGLSSLDGMDASENETTHSIKYENNKWYRFRVRVTGEVIRCWLDDKEIVAVQHSEKHVRTRIEVRANEPLGFAAWKTGGALRNLEIRPLSPAEVAANNKIE
jgi:Domain of Unknown Function (DUF1080)